MSLIGRIYAPDVAVLPIGDHFTMGPREAAVALELLGVVSCVPCHYGTFGLLTGTPDELRELAPPGVEVLSPEPGETIDLLMRERWFGATGRKVPQIALEGTVDLEGALVLDDVSDLEAIRTAHDAGNTDRRPRVHGRGGACGALAGRGRLRARRDESLLALDLPQLTYG